MSLRTRGVLSRFVLELRDAVAHWRVPARAVRSIGGIGLKLDRTAPGLGLSSANYEIYRVGSNLAESVRFPAFPPPCGALAEAGVNRQTAEGHFASNGISGIFRKARFYGPNRTSSAKRITFLQGTTGDCLTSGFFLRFLNN
jgi:hypothetical protein